MYETLELVGLSALALFLYAYFFYWYATRNRKIDVYVQPHIFDWRVKTGLLLVGTVLILVLSVTSSIIADLLIVSLMLVLWPIAPLIQTINLPLLLFTGLFSLVVWPAGIWLGLVFQGSNIFMLLGGVLIYFSLFISGRHAVDTLIIRLKMAGHSREADHLEQNGRIGLLALMVGIFLPMALFTRWIRRGTKTGTIKITLAIYQGSRTTTSWYTVVDLPEMLTTREQVQRSI